MKFRVVKTAVTKSSGEGFNILAYKGTVRVTDGTSVKLCHAVEN